MTLEGQLLGHGDYRLLARIGYSKTGEVYRAEDNQRHQVAIKVIQARKSSPSGIRETPHILSEKAEIIRKKFNFPHILPLLDYGDDVVNGLPLSYLVMPLCSGESLTTIIDWHREHNSFLPLQNVAYFVHQAAEALQYAHNYKIIHCDVKPSNFLTRSNPANPYLPDLLLNDFEIVAFNTTSSGTGTPMYMAPEQWNGSPVSATDQYALAIMTYQLLTHRFPFQGDVDIRHQHLSARPQPPSTLNPSLPKDVDAVILQALAKKPEQRFSTVSAFEQAFQKATQSGMRSFSQITSSHTVSNSSTSSMMSNKGDNMSSDSKSTSTLTTRRANALLYLVATVILGAIAGAILYGLNRLPGYIVAIGVSLGTVMGFISAVLGLVFEKPTPANIFEKANLFRTLLASLVTVGLLTWIVLQLPSTLPFPYPSPQPTSTIPTSSPQPHPSPQPTQPGPSPTPQPSTTQSNAPADPYTQKGTLVLDDPLNDNNKGYKWDNGTDNSGDVCRFPGQGYHLIIQQGGGIECNTNTQTTNLKNCVYQVTMTVTHGDATGGIVFHEDDQHHSFYYFVFDEYGNYTLGKFQNGAFLSPSLKHGYSPSFHSGSGASNLLAIVVVGDRIDFYVNGEPIDFVVDSTFSRGQIGVIAQSGQYSTQTTEVVFSNAQVWTL